MMSERQAALVTGLYGSLDSIDELEAVNEILEVVGESPVSSLDAQGDVDVANARRVLASENKRIQSKGWAFNIEEGVSLEPDIYSGIIRYDASYLSVLEANKRTTYINRNGRVWDTTSRTDRFDAPITINMIVARKLDEMPYAVRNLIVLSAAKRFNAAYFGDDSVDVDIRDRLMLATVDCADYESDFSKVNILENTDVQQFLQR